MPFFGTQFGTRFGTQFGTMYGGFETEFSVAITDSADPVIGGDEFDYVITVTNVGDDAENVEVTFTLDPATTYVSGSGTGWTVNEAGGVVTATRASLPEGPGPAITITVDAGNTDSSLSASVVATADNVAEPVEDTETTTVTLQTTMTVGIVDSDDPVDAFDSFDYAITATNTGSHAATNVELEFTLDPALAYVSGSGTGWTVNESGGVVTATRATMAVGPAAVITITVDTDDSDATLTSGATLNADNAPQATDSENTAVNITTDLSIAITDSADPILAEDSFSYSVVATNDGPLTAENVEVVITLDAALTFVNASGTGWSCNESGGVVTCTRGTGAVGALPTITVNVTSDNSVGVLSTDVDLDADNATAPANDTETTDVAQYDGPGDWYRPKSVAEYTLIGAANVPSYAYMCQDASGNLQPAIGATVLTAANSPQYQQSVAGWTCDAVGFTEGTSNQGFSMAAGLGPDLTTDSVALLAYIHFTGATSGVNRHVMSLGIADPDEDNVVIYAPDATALFRLRAENNGTNGTLNTDGKDIALLMVFDQTNNVSRFYYTDMSTGTPGEIVSATHSGSISVDGYKTLGTVPVSAGNAYNAEFQCTYFAIFEGADAEFTEATATSLFQALGVPTRFSCPFDGPSPYINYPLTTAHFASAQITEPLSVWGMQEASGNLTSDGGTSGFDLTAVTTPQYSQAIEDHTRKGIQYDSAGGDGHAAASGTGPSPASTSVLWYYVANVTGINDGHIREILTIGGGSAATQCSLLANGAAGGATLRVKCMTATADGATDIEAGTAMGPFVLLYDRTNSRVVGYTLTDKVVGTYDSGVLDGQKGHCYMGYNNNPGVRGCYSAVWSGANAELTDQQVFDLLVAFGWTPTWTP